MPIFAFSLAKPEMAESLQALARRSKQHWGYDAAYMSNWQHDQSLTRAYLETHLVLVAEADQQLCGFFALLIEDNEAELEHFWIEPAYIGGGLGKTLFQKLRDTLKHKGIKHFKVVVEPNAEGFYLKMGGKIVGEITKPGIAHAFPLMQVPV